MAKQPMKSVESAARIAEKAMPGWKAVGTATTYANAPSAEAVDSDGEPKAGTDAILPSLNKLRKKFFGEQDSADPESAVLDSPTDDVEVVEMESGKHRKLVGVRNGKKAWEQG